MRVIVTGGTGKGGRHVVADLREHGHEVRNVDARHDGSPFGQCLVADLTDWARPRTPCQGSTPSSISRPSRRPACGPKPADYAVFPSWQDDPTVRRWNLWGYVDARDVAQAARLALTAPIEEAETCIVAAADTVMIRPSADLMAAVFPPSRSAGRSPVGRRCSRSSVPGASWDTNRVTAGRIRFRGD